MGIGTKVIKFDLKEMMDNKPEKPKPLRKISNKKISPKPPKNGFMWVYAVIIALVLGGMLYTSNGSIVQIDNIRFENMLAQHDVESVVAYKSSNDICVAEVHIKKSSLSKPEYNDV